MDEIVGAASEGDPPTLYSIDSGIPGNVLSPPTDVVDSNSENVIHCDDQDGLFIDDNSESLSPTSVVLSDLISSNQTPPVYCKER